MTSPPSPGDPDDRPPPLRAARPAPPAGLARALGLELVLARVQGAPPPVVGRYRIQDRLGEGGMGVVFRAHDPDLDRPVAVKVMHGGASERARARMAEEAKALARLNHEHVLVVYDTGTRDGQAWVAMEFVQGRTLRAWRADHPEAGWASVLRPFVACARGLAAAHRAGIVHRDFKPDNVLVGDDGRVRVADFGLARLDEREGAPREALTEDGTVPGTQGYLPPELLLGEPATPHSDQYSFFVALQELLQASEDPTAVGCPPALHAVIRRGLAAQPADRWGSMDVVADLLATLMAEPAHDPQRALFLDRVERLWVDGVLGRAIELGGYVPLRLRDATERVDAPWAGLPGFRGAALRPGTTDDLVRELERGHGSLLVLGDAGAGKTTALARMTRDLLGRARQDVMEPVPAVLHLASFGHRPEDFGTWVEDELVVKYGVARPRARAWIQRDQLVLLLDGLDEVPETRRAGCLAALGAFRGAHAVGIVVTCRTRAYEALGRRLACGAAVELEPPNDAEAARMLAGPSSRGSSLREAAPTLPDTLPRSPLLLALLREVGPPPSGTGPTAAVYDAYVDRALARPPQLAPDLRRARRAQLAWLAANLRRLGSRELWLEHLQADWLPGAGRRLAARALGALTIASLLLGVDLAAAHLAGRTPDVGWMIWGVSVIMVFVLNGGLQVRPMQALTWSARRSLAKVPVLAAFAVVFAAIFAAIHPFLPNLILDACACAVLAVLLGLEPSVEPSSLRPGEGLRQSLINSLAIGPVAAVLAGGAVGYLGVPLAIPYCPPDSPLLTLHDPRFSSTLTMGALTGGVAAMVVGGAAVVLHASLRVVLALTTPLPLFLVPWLDDAADRGLLLRVGGGWMFQHGTMLDHLARTADRKA